jgi:hypothetical protein
LFIFRISTQKKKKNTKKTPHASRLAVRVIAGWPITSDSPPPLRYAVDGYIRPLPYSDRLKLLSERKKYKKDFIKSGVFKA